MHNLKLCFNKNFTVIYQKKYNQTLFTKKKKKAITNMILIRPRKMAKISTNFKTNQQESQGELR